MMELANVEANVYEKIGNDDKKNEAIVEELVALCLEHLKKLNNVDLKQKLKESFDFTLKRYLSYRESTATKQWEKYKGVLINEIKNAFRDFCMDISNKSSASFTKVILSFRSQVDALVDSKCRSPDMLQTILCDVKSIILQQHANDPVIDAEQLKIRLDEEALSYISENQKCLEQFYNMFESILPNLLEKFEFLVQLSLPDDVLETASDTKLESVFQKCQNQLLKKLSIMMNFEDQDLKDIFESNLIAMLRNQFAKDVNVTMAFREEKLTEARFIVTTAVETFAQSLSAAFKQISDESAMNSIRNEKCKDLLITITEQIYEILSDNSSAKQMLEIAKQEMESVFQQMKSERLVQLEQFHERWEAELNQLCDEFKIRFAQHLASDKLPEIDEMRENREVLINQLIRETNTSWLNERNDRKDLLNAFHKEINERVNITSTSIFEDYEGMAEKSFQQQKLVMEKCLEGHQLKISDLLKEDLNDEMVRKAKHLTAMALQQFDCQVKSVSPRIVSATIHLRDKFQQAITIIQNEFEKEIQNQRIVMINEVNQMVTDAVNDYKCLISAFSIATHFNLEKISHIHQNLKNRASNNLQENLKLSKYSTDTVEQQRKVGALIETHYNDARSEIEKRQIEWNQTLKLCNDKASSFYQQQFTSSMNFVKHPEELENLHKDCKEQAVGLWEESFPMNYLGDSLFHERRKYAKQLDNDFATKMVHLWEQINSDIDRNTKAVVEDLVKQYKTDMTSALKQFSFVSKEFILSNNKKLLQEAKRNLDKVDKPKNTSREAYQDLLSSRIANSLECIQIENIRNKEVVQNEISSHMNQLKRTMRQEIFDLKALPETSTLLKNYWDNVHQFLNNYTTTDDCHEELKTFATKNLKEIVTALEIEWNNIEPDSNALQLSINKAIELYNKEMENRTSKKGQAFASSAMKIHHTYALATVQKEFQLNVKQTMATREKFNDAILQVRQKFEDLNNLKAAECSDAAIGIDLGTTFSCVAIYKGGKIEMIPDREHHNSTVPSYVYYETASKVVIGHSAKDQSVIHPQNTIFDSKRLIGRKFDDSQTQEDITQWPFKVVKDPNPKRNAAKIEVHEKTFHPEEISGEILKYLKSNAESYLGREVKDVVITVPAYFNDAQKRATKNAATFAELNLLEIINEPTSAAIAYSLNYTEGKSKNILVFDLGGGTFDVSVLTIDKGDIVVKAVGGDNHLGGEDFDSNMVDFCIQKFAQETGHQISKNVSRSSANDDVQLKKTYEVLRRLRHKCEQAKVNLSKTEKVRVVIDYIIDQMHLDIEITVQEFNEMNKSLFEKCILVVEDTIQQSKLNVDQIDDIILVGGSSRIPEVQRLLSEFFNGKSLIMKLNPDEVVAQGAAYRAAMISGSKCRELAGIKFRDVNPLPLGIAIVGEKFGVIIPKNTPIPTKRTETFYTDEDYQTEVLVQIYEGEDSQVANNNLLGEFYISDIPEKVKGEPVDVTIECDVEGLIHVTAKVRSSDNVGDIKIHANRGDLTEEDIKNVMSGVSIVYPEITSLSEPPPTGVLRVFPSKKEFIGQFAIEDVQNDIGGSKLYQTIIILDQSGSMASTFERVLTRILPLFFSKLSYQHENLINLITFETISTLHVETVADFRNLKLCSNGGTNMHPAIAECKNVFKNLNKNEPVRILTISDGEICDQRKTSAAADVLKVFLEKESFLINSKAVRLFTSSSQPDTTALCSLLQLNNATPKSLVDIEVKQSDDFIATTMAELFMEDNFDKTQILKTTETIIRRQPWNTSSAQLLYSVGLNNVWLSEVPKDGLTLNNVPLKIAMQEPITKEQHKTLMDSKSNLILETMKILKVVNSNEANKTLECMNKYFKANVRASALTKKANTIVNDASVAEMTSSEKALYLIRE